MSNTWHDRAQKITRKERIMRKIIMTVAVLAALTLIGEAESPLSVPMLAAELGIHRSMAYRLVKTLEQHGFVERLPSGDLELGIRLAALTRGVARGLDSVAAYVASPPIDRLMVGSAERSVSVVVPHAFDMDEGGLPRAVGIVLHRRNGQVVLIHGLILVRTVRRR